MQEFEILPHTADVAVRARGSSRGDFIAAAVRGMFAAAQPEFRQDGAEVTRSFDLQAVDFPSLLIAVLNEVIYLASTEREVYDAVDFDSVSETTARGTLRGHPVIQFATEIKAATHHDLRVEEKDSTWEATIIFDA